MPGAAVQQSSIRRIRPVLALIVVLSSTAPAIAQPGRADLARARSLYNQRQFDASIDAATAARRTPAIAHAAAIVEARARLERYRERSDPSDLSAARAALGTVREAGLDARDRLEFLLAAGESLFLEDEFGASADIFEIGLLNSGADAALHEALLEWWGSAIERLAGALPRDRRIATFGRLAERMREELARSPGSAPASYWMVVALRGAGDPGRAWDAAVAAWVRARLMGDRAAMLRADLDHLMQDGIIPDRARVLAQPERAAATAQFKADWELVKEKWK